MLSNFFLERPVFAWVIAIVIMLVGALAIYNLPVSQYPPSHPHRSTSGPIIRGLRQRPLRTA